MSMGSSSTPRAGPAGGFGASGWMITFADLLTLLLCFFLALVSGSKLNPANRSKQDRQNTAQVGNSATAASTGTAIATSSDQNEARDHFFTLLLTARDFDRAGIELTERALKKIRKQVVSGGYQSAGATVDFCAQSGSKADQRNRMLTVHRQLIDAGFMRTELRIGTGSQPCRAAPNLGQEAQGEEVVTRITWQPRAAAHG